MPEGKEFTPKGEAEIRQSVIEEFGLDADSEDNKPFLEKVVKKELDRQNDRAEYLKKEADYEKKLSKAIEQKVKYRDEAKKLASLEEDPAPEPSFKPTGESPEPQKQAENEKLTALEKKVLELESSNHRSKYSHLKEDEYNTVMSIAGGIEKFEETLNGNPMVKNYIETNRINERVSGATASPSTRTNPGATMSFDEVDLGNQSHLSWLKSDPNRMKDYEAWLDKGGSKTLNY